MKYQVHSKKREGVSGPTGEAHSSALGLRKAQDGQQILTQTKTGGEPRISVSALIQSKCVKSRVDSRLSEGDRVQIQDRVRASGL